MKVKLAMALQSIRITQVWAALGGGPLRHGRGRAFWRAGDGWSVSVKDGRGWFDHRDGRGGGILDLVQAALGCDRRGALRWVAEEFVLDTDCERPVTAKERWQYACARSEAERFVCWRDDKIDSMRRGRNYHF